jgi:predicted nucleic acid-binding protein
LSFVTDASVLAAWFLDEKADPRVEAAFEELSRVEARAPGLFYYEIRNFS